AVSSVFHPTAPARDALPGRGWGILGALYADGNQPLAAARPGRGTRPSLWRAAFAGGSGRAAGSRVRGLAPPAFLGTVADRHLRRGLHPGRPGRARLTVPASVAARAPSVRLAFEHRSRVSYGFAPANSG